MTPDGRQRRANGARRPRTSRTVEPLEEPIERESLERNSLEQHGERLDAYDPILAESVKQEYVSQDGRTDGYTAQREYRVLSASGNHTRPTAIAAAASPDDLLNGRVETKREAKRNVDQETNATPYYLIEGGVPLRGEVRLSGAKNAATKLMVAALLTEVPCEIRNAPQRLGDVTIIEDVIRALGAKVTWRAEHTVIIEASTLANGDVPDKLGGKNRLAVLSVGPLLHRLGHASIPAPGGDRIGPRPINFHLDGLRRMGAIIEERDGHFHFSVKNGLRGATIELPFPSVMATETLIIAATLAKGVTVIENAAIEPEIIDLIKFLQKMGAIIEQRVDRKIVIEGVQRLHGASHYVISDRNEAVSLAIGAYLTHGDVRLLGADQGSLLTFLNTLYRVGLDFAVEDDAIRFFGDDTPPRPIALETDVHPGFMTDWQQPFTVLLTQARGMSVIHETIYEDRFGYTTELNRMGADTGLYPKCLGEAACRFRERDFQHSCVVRGPTPLKATELTMPDIRAGASYILAALCAEGTSVVRGIEHIERGYEHLDEKLSSLGARITRVPAR